MYLLLEIILRPIFHLLNSFSEFQLKLGSYGIGPRAHLFDPDWWLEINKDRDLIFTKKRNNNKKKVYELLKTNPNGVEKEEILKNVKIKYDDLRSIISQLQKDLKYQRIYKQIVVEKGVYKITLFNRKLGYNPLEFLS